MNVFYGCRYCSVEQLAITGASNVLLSLSSLPSLLSSSSMSSLSNVVDYDGFLFIQLCCVICLLSCKVVIADEVHPCIPTHLTFPFFGETYLLDAFILKNQQFSTIQLGLEPAAGVHQFPPKVQICSSIRNIFR